MTKGTCYFCELESPPGKTGPPLTTVLRIKRGDLVSWKGSPLGLEEFPLCAQHLTKLTRCIDLTNEVWKSGGDNVQRVPHPFTGRD